MNSLKILLNRSKPLLFNNRLINQSLYYSTTQQKFYNRCSLYNINHNIHKRNNYSSTSNNDVIQNDTQLRNAYSSMLKNSDYQSAKKQIDSLEKLHPNKLTTYDLLSYSYIEYHLGNHHESLKRANQAFEIISQDDLNDPLTYDLYVRIVYKKITILSNNNERIKALREAFDKKPNVQIAFNIAHFLHLEDQKEEAYNYTAIALDLYNQNAEGSEMSESVKESFLISSTIFLIDGLGKSEIERFLAITEDLEILLRKQPTFEMKYYSTCVKYLFKSLPNSDQFLNFRQSLSKNDDAIFEHNIETTFDIQDAINHLQKAQQILSSYMLSNNLKDSQYLNHRMLIFSYLEKLGQSINTPDLTQGDRKGYSLMYGLNYTTLNRY